MQKKSSMSVQTGAGFTITNLEIMDHSPTVFCIPCDILSTHFHSRHNLIFHAESKNIND